MTLLEVSWLLECDQIADYFAVLGQYSPAVQAEGELPARSHPLRWVAELGLRQGRWMRGEGAAAGAAA